MKLTIELGPITTAALAKILAMKTERPAPVKKVKPETTHGSKPGRKPGGEYKPRDKYVAIKGVAARLHISSPAVRDLMDEAGIKERPFKNYILSEDAVRLVNDYKS